MPPEPQPLSPLQKAFLAYKKGHLTLARWEALRSALQDPGNETSWLLLAAVSKPRESVQFVHKALQINPHSERALSAMQWAIRRLPPEPLPQTIEGLPTVPPSGRQLIPEKSSQPSVVARQKIVKYISSRVLASLLILLLITIMAFLGLYLSRQGQLGQPVEILPTIQTVGGQVFRFFTGHAQNYIWHKQHVPALQLISELFINSAGLLSVALLVGAFLGVTIGILAAFARSRVFSPLILLVTLPGISIPSFLLAMLFWVVNIKVSNAAGVNRAFLPPIGFGWDLHLVMPALVLAARPFAQVMQVTYVNLSDVLTKEFIQAARARGASWPLVLFRHALPNILIPVLTTLAASLRYSLASLPVVESFFLWPGIGLAILQAFSLDMPELIVDLVCMLGLLFLTVNFILDLLYLVIDPRLRKNTEESMDEESAWEGFFDSSRKPFKDGISAFLASLRRILPGRRTNTTGTKAHSLSLSTSSSIEITKPIKVATAPAPEEIRSQDSRFILRKALSNPLLVFGSLSVILLLILAAFGDKFSQASPYQTNTIVKIAGKISAPPFPPSQEFPWGSDLVGRDIQALVLAGAKQTLSLAFFAMLARVGLGVLLGMIAGWWDGRWPDRLIHMFISVLAAFPVTIFAMIIILALGIQKGMPVFVLAFCLVGWGEITQYVRSVVISQKPLQYVEAARSIGAQAVDILHRHILPHLVPAVLVVAILEMSSVLMLLAELGFLNIFLGGGFSATVAETTGMQAVKYFFSDIPEWGSLLANIRNWWRSYPWLAWYPGVFFFFAILVFNIWGEGMRRFIEESRINISRLINRYSLLAAGLLLGIALWSLRTASPLTLYARQSSQFNTVNVITDIHHLASPIYQGRESALPANKNVADYLASRMEEIGLFPAGQNQTFLREQKVIYTHITSTPTLSLLGVDGSTKTRFDYNRDFREYVARNVSIESVQGNLVGLTVGQGTGQLTGKPLSLRGLDLHSNILLISEQDLPNINLPAASGILVISDNEAFLSRRELYPQFPLLRSTTSPMLRITPHTADTLLKTAGSSLEQFNRLRTSLPPDEAETTNPGSMVQISLQGSGSDQIDSVYDVIGYIPGNSAETNPITGQKMDSQVILVTAYYDGVGMDPDGTLYPGANDNASGVAVMLELARLLMDGEFKPEKTIVFAAWSEGERGKSFSVTNTMASKIGFSGLDVEAVIELSGLAAGEGKGLTLDQGSSYRLVSLFEKAARKSGVSLTTRGRGPHFGRVSRPDFGGRTALSAYLSWDGSDKFAHTPLDDLTNIDPAHIQKSGETAALVLTLLSRESDY